MALYVCSLALGLGLCTYLYACCVYTHFVLFTFRNIIVYQRFWVILFSYKHHKSVVKVYDCRCVTPTNIVVVLRA